jgi:hypothetical protein
MAGRGTVLASIADERRFLAMLADAPIHPVLLAKDLEAVASQRCWKSLTA